MGRWSKELEGPNPGKLDWGCHLQGHLGATEHCLNSEASLGSAGLLGGTSRDAKAGMDTGHAWTPRWPGWMGRQDGIQQSTSLE